MKLRAIVATGCVAALAGLASGQEEQCMCPCSTTDPGSTDPGSPGTPGVNVDEQCNVPEEEKPWFCALGTGEPEVPPECAVEGEKPWYCDPTQAYPEVDPFSVVTDEETGLTFGQFNAEFELYAEPMSLRVAQSASATAGEPYDVILQIIAPNTVGWAAMAWGGTMIGNPLTVAWASCNDVVVSSRWANVRELPTNYAGASYEIIKSGTYVNNTHWKLTTRCTGCTSWRSSSGNLKVLDPGASNALAWAYAMLPPADPSNSSSVFGYHDSHNTWNQDFSLQQNANFEEAVGRMKAAPAPPPPSPTGEDGCAYTNPALAALPKVTVYRTVTVATMTETVTATQSCS